MVNQGKSLNQLGVRGGYASLGDPSPMMRAILALFDKPIRNFTVEDLRLVVGQNIGLEYLMPYAIAVLKKDPLAEGMHFAGDLLCNVLRVDAQFYRLHPDVRQDVQGIVADARSASRLLSKIDADCFNEVFDEAYQYFEATMDI
jgi:hypothetical protein